MENKQHNTALLQKIQTKSAAPSTRKPLLLQGVQAARELCYHLIPPCMEEMQSCESQLCLHGAAEYVGVPWEGGHYSQKVLRATCWLFPGLSTCKRWAAPMARVCWRSAPPRTPAAAGVRCWCPHTGGRCCLRSSLYIRKSL